MRGKLYELLVNCIPPELILRRMALELLPRLDDELKHKLVEQAAFFEHRLQARARVQPLACTAWHGLVAMRVRAQRSTAAFVCVEPSSWPGISELWQLGDLSPLPTWLICIYAAQEGQKAIYHLEAFVARFMSDYKVWTISALG